MAMLAFFVPSVKCPNTHWHHIKSYLPSDGTKSWRPWHRISPTRPSSTSSFKNKVFACSTKLGACSTRSTFLNGTLSKKFLVTRPIPAPQSHAYPFPIIGGLRRTLFAPRTPCTNSWTKLREPFVSIGSTDANPPSMPFMVGDTLVQYFWALSYQSGWLMSSKLSPFFRPFDNSLVSFQ